MTRPTADPDRPIRIGMVGSGFMARYHSAGYQLLPLTYGSRVPRVELVRIAGGSGVHDAVRDFGWASGVDDWRAVTEADDIDVVDIVTPNSTHAEISQSAAAAGKHILCEKPLAVDHQQAVAMTAAVETAGVQTGVAFVYRTWPAVQAAKAMIERGDLGTVHGYRGHFLHDHITHGRDAADSWRFDKNRAGSGVIGDIGSHALDLARYLVGDIDQIYATARSIIPTPTTTPIDQVEDEADLLMRFASGATGSIWLSWLATGTPMDLGFHIMGDRGALKFNWEQPNHLRYYRTAENADTQGYTRIPLGPAHSSAAQLAPVAGIGIGYRDAFTVLLSQFLSGLQQRRQLAPSFAEATIISRYLEAAIQSTHTDQWRGT